MPLVPSSQTAGYGFAPVIPKVDPQSQVEWKPLSFAGGMQSPIQFKPLPAWEIMSGKPELVAQGVSQGVSSISKGVETAYELKNKKDIELEKAKKDLDKRKAELTEKLAEKNLEMEFRRWDRENDPFRRKAEQDLQGAKSGNVNFVDYSLPANVKRDAKPNPDLPANITGEGLMYNPLLKSQPNTLRALYRGLNAAEKPPATPAPPVPSGSPVPSATLPDKKLTSELDAIRSTDLFNSGELPAIDQTELSVPKFDLASAPVQQAIPQSFIDSLNNLDPKYLQVAAGGAQVPPVPFTASSLPPAPARPAGSEFMGAGRGILTQAGEKAPQLSSWASTQQPPRPEMASREQPVPERQQGRYTHSGPPKVGYIADPQLAQYERERNIEGYQPKGELKIHKDVKNPYLSQMYGRDVYGVFEVERKPMTADEYQKYQQGQIAKPELSKEQIGLINNLYDNVNKNKIYTTGVELSQKRQVVKNSLTRSTGFADIAAINAFQKMVDEGVAVREGDIALMRSAQAILDKYDPRFLTNKATKGTILTLKDRIEMDKLSEMMAKNAMQQANEGPIKQFRGIAQKANLSPDDIVREFKIQPSYEEIQTELKSLRDSAISLEAKKAQTTNPQEKQNLQMQIDEVTAKSRQLASQKQ